MISSISVAARARATLVVAAALLAAAVPAEARAQTQVPAQLELEEAIALGLRNNPGVLVVTNDLDISDVRIREAYGAFLPNVGFSTNFRSSYSEQRTTTGNFGEPLETPQAVISKTSSASQSINLGSITLYDGWRSFRGVDIARAQRDVTEASIGGRHNTLRAAITRAYYQIVSAEDRIVLERQLLAVARTRLGNVQEKFRIAAAKQTDVLGAELEVSQREQSLFTAELDARRRRLDLLQQMGIAGEPEFDAVSALPAIIDPAALDAEALVARAVDSHPTVLQNRASVDIAESQASNARAARLPTVSLGLPSYSWGATESGMFDAWGQLGAPNNSFSFSVGASLPIFSGFQTSLSIAQGEAAAEDARLQAREARLQIERDVRSAFYDLQQMHRNVLLAEQQAELARVRLELAQEEYSVGATDYTSLQQIVESNDQAQRSAIEARFAYLNARVALEERIGTQLDAGN